MTFEKAAELSEALAKAGVSHTVYVGRHDNLTPGGPTNHPGIHCRVDLGWPRSHQPAFPIPGVGPSIGEQVRALEKIAESLDLVLETGIMGEGLTFSVRRRVS